MVAELAALKLKEVELGFMKLNGGAGTGPEVLLAAPDAVSQDRGEVSGLPDTSHQNIVLNIGLVLRK